MPDTVGFDAARWRTITQRRGERDAQPAIAVRGLVKSFDEVEAVRGVEFEVAAGEVFGFLGPNGAGKTTTINMLCTLAKPTAGARRGRRPRRRPRARRRPPPHRPRLPGPDARRLPDRRAEPAAARRALRRPVATWSQPRMRQVLEMVGLWDRSDAPVADLLRRHAPPAGDRARPDALAARAVPRRADDRPRPADARARSGATSASSRSARTSRSS